ncbi:hypothetical protein COLO4_10057 [Corchorus olitorius]|uniref:Uncharacterized protein n=1 Tax=Corchorus olitorius TaxID=93759 RepID=A0A1R3KA37_9ROSI|nr:hypothetical protein COLO4_10057 [Corchorus olitorius]
MCKKTESVKAVDEGDKRGPWMIVSNRKDRKSRGRYRRRSSNRRRRSGTRNRRSRSTQKTDQVWRPKAEISNFEIQNSEKLGTTSPLDVAGPSGISVGAQVVDQLVLGLLVDEPNSPLEANSIGLVDQKPILVEKKQIRVKQSALSAASVLSTLLEAGYSPDTAQHSINLSTPFLVKSSEANGSIQQLGQLSNEHGTTCDRASGEIIGNQIPRDASSGQCQSGGRADSGGNCNSPTRGSGNEEDLDFGMDGRNVAPGGLVRHKDPDGRGGITGVTEAGSDQGDERETDCNPDADEVGTAKLSPGSDQIEDGGNENSVSPKGNL